MLGEWITGHFCLRFLHHAALRDSLPSYCEETEVTCPIWSHDVSNNVLKVSQVSSHKWLNRIEPTGNETSHMTITSYFAVLTYGIILSKTWCSLSLKSRN